MNFEQYITQAVANLTTRLNQIVENARKITELPWQSTLRPGSEMQVSNPEGVSEKITVQQILDAALSFRQNQLISANVSVLGNDVTVDAGAEWVINNINYELASDFEETVPYAETGYTRNDILVADQSNNIYRIVGPETEGISPTPNVPLNTVLVTTINVTDSTIGYVPPVIGPYDSDDIINISGVTGAKVTDALNTLDTGKADDANVLHKTGNETKSDILTIANTLNLAPIVVNSTDGYITKNSQPFIHNFYAGVNPLQGGSGNNLNVGYNSGNFNADNFNYASTMLGFESGLSNKNGYSNVGIGYRNLHLNQNGFGNSALGTYVLGNLTTGTQNTAIGWHCMLYSTTASENTAVGVEALWNNLVGLRNTALGMRAGTSNTGDDNVFIGYNAGGAYTGSNKLYIANTNRTLIEGDFSGNGFVTLNGAGEFMVAPSRKITFKNASGVEASLGWFSNLNTETNAYLDAFDYRIRTGGTVRLQISNSGVASFSSTVNAGSAASSANDLMRKGETDTALALKANLASPPLTGTPTAPTAVSGTNTTQVATTAFVQAALPTSGTYTPTLSATGNTSALTLVNATYSRIGNIVNVTIGFTVTLGIANTNSSFTATLPVNRSGSGLIYVGSGSIGNSTGTLSYWPIECTSSSTTLVTALFNPVTTAGNYAGSITFQYSI